MNIRRSRRAFLRFDMQYITQCLPRKSLDVFVKSMHLSNLVSKDLKTMRQKAFLSIFIDFGFQEVPNSCVYTVNPEKKRIAEYANRPTMQNCSNASNL